MRRFGWILLLPFLLLAKSYHYSEIITDIYFDHYGNAVVRQSRTYDFKGSFSYAYLKLKKQGSKNISFSQLLEKINGKWEILNPIIEDNPNNLYLKWHYSAQDETKTFLLDYSINGALKRYQDVSEFYWKFIEDEHEKIDKIVLNLYLPTNYPDFFKVYIHSQGRNGELYFSDDSSSATAVLYNIPANHFVEVRMLTASDVFSEAELINENRYAQILNEEKRNFMVSLIKKLIFFPIGVILLIITPIIILIIFYHRYGKEPPIPYLGTYEHEPPRKISPILLPAILLQSPDQSTKLSNVFQAVFATILDLTTKGFISIQELGQKNKYRFVIEKPDKINELDLISKDVVSLFFGGNNSVTDSDLKHYAEKNRSGFRNRLSDLYDSAKIYWRETLQTDLIDPQSKKAYHHYLFYTAISILLSVIFSGIGISAFLGHTNPGAFSIAFIAGIVLFLIFFSVGKSILRWTPQALNEQKRWLNFKRFLTDFSLIKQAPLKLLVIWEHYFVYAVALGVAQKFLKNITELAKQTNQILTVPAWYLSTRGNLNSLQSFTENINSFQNFVNNFSSMMNSFSTASSSGGGFSSGGGSGGGGGSSGAG